MEIGTKEAMDFIDRGIVEKFFAEDYNFSDLSTLAQKGNIEAQQILSKLKKT